VTDFWRDIESLTVKHGGGGRLAEVDNSRIARCSGSLWSAASRPAKTKKAHKSSHKSKPLYCTFPIVLL
jgi:hypothetical protein